MTEYFPSTGHKAVDSLQGLQRIVSWIIDPEERLEHLQQGIRRIDTDQLIRHQFAVSAQNVLMNGSEDQEKERRPYPGVMMFVGRVSSVSYIKIPDTSIDSLVLTFRDSDVMGVSPERAEQLRVSRLQIPVLDIETCVQAEAA